MLWYLLRTWPGREEMLVKEIQKTVPSYLYQEVFVIYNERIWRRQGESIIHAEPLFPGCVFLTCEKTDPFFMYMQRVPAMSALLASGELSAYPLMDADTEFLEQITDETGFIKRSLITEKSHIYRPFSGSFFSHLVRVLRSPRSRFHHVGQGIFSSSSRLRI